MTCLLVLVQLKPTFKVAFKTLGYMYFNLMVIFLPVHKEGTYKFCFVCFYIIIVYFFHWQ